MAREAKQRFNWRGFVSVATGLSFLAMYIKTSPAMNPWRQNPDPFFSSKRSFLRARSRADYQKGFLLIRLHYAQDLRNPQAYFEDITDGQVPKDQLQLAEQLLKNKTAPFEPLLFKDRYKIEAKPKNQRLYHKAVL